MIIRKINQLRQEHAARSPRRILEIRLPTDGVLEMADETYMTAHPSVTRSMTAKQWRKQVWDAVEAKKMRLFGIPVVHDRHMPFGTVSLHSEVATHVSMPVPDDPATTAN